MPIPFEPTASRMMDAVKAKNISALARVLCVTPQALSNYKKRGEMPANLVIEFAGKHGLSIDGLLNGAQVVPAVRLNCPNIINVELALEEAKYVNKALKILRISRDGLGQVFRASLDAIVEKQEQIEAVTALDEAAKREAPELFEKEAPHV